MITKLKKNLPVMLTVFLACIVYIWRLWDEGLANLYYSAGVYSMGQNIHAFFYNSIDSVGFISIDKPPLGLWIQVLFTKVLGFNGMAILLPQALAGVFSVYFLYKIINKRFGQIAGITSALVLALTPILAAISRNNTIDGILILMLVLASDQVIKAAEKSSLKHLIFAGILIGLGFNVKMLQAFMIVPAVYLTYFVFSKQKIAKRLLACAISAVILLAISASWMIAVDLTPTQNRPYVGSSGTNSAFSLALGYNGINRLLGGNGSNKSGVPMGMPNGQENNRPAPPNGNTRENMPPPPNGGAENRPPLGNPSQQGNNGGGPRAEGGSTSIVRLYNNEVSGQISWFLLPAMLVSLLFLYLIFRKKLKEHPQYITLFYFSMCFIPMFIYFSFSNGMVHRYYLAMFSFPIAALIGIGVSFLMAKSKQFKFIIPVAFMMTAVAQLYIQSLYQNWLNWLLPLAAVIFLIVLGLILLGIKKNFKNELLAFLMAVLFILPGVWAFTPILYGNNAQLPIAGPELVKQGDNFDRQSDLTKLIAYLKENRGNAAYLACVPSAMSMGAELILQSKEPVMVLGGFNGGDKPLTVDTFKTMISEGKVKYAIINDKGNIPSAGNSQSDITAWITQNCKTADMQFNGGTLYELSINEN